MISFELTDPVFNKKKTTEYELSVLLGADSLSYCITDAERRVLSVVKTDLPELAAGQGYADKTETVILRNVALQQSYRSVNLAIFNGLSTFIPQRLYDPEQKAVYLEKMLPIDEHHEIRDEIIPSADARLVYAVPGDVMRVLRTYFSSAVIKHAATVLLDGYRKTAETEPDANTGKRVYLHVRSEALQVFFYDDRELIFYNSFPYSSSKDFIYFVMLVYDQFGLQADETPVYLSGELMEDSEIYHLIFRYVRHLHLMPLPGWLHFSEQWSSRPQHRFFDLFCEFV